MGALLNLLLAVSLLAGIGSLANAQVKSFRLALLKDPTSVGLIAAAKDYEKEKGIKVEIVELPFSTLYEKVVLSIFNRTGAYDVVMLDDPWFPRFAEAGFLANLTELMKRRGLPPVDEDFIGKSLALGKHPYPATAEEYVKSPVYALPYAGNVQLFFYRKDLFERSGVSHPPKTWDEVLRAAKAIRAKEKRVYGFVFRGQQGNAIVSDFLPIFWSFGAEVFDAAWKPHVNGPDAVRALELLLALKGESPPGVENFGAENILVHLLQGTAAQDIGWPPWVPLLADPKKSRVVGKMAYSTIPSGSVTGASEIGHWLIGIPRDSRRQDQALDFVVWATSKRQMKIAAMRGSPPVRTSLYQDADLVKKFPHYPVQLQAILNSKPRPRTPVWDQVENAFGLYLAKAVGKSLGAKDALDAANTEIERVMRRTGIVKD